MRGVPLLTRRFPIALQYLVDELAHRPELRTVARWSLPLWRNRARQRLPDQPPMCLQLLGDSLDRAHPNLMLPPNLFEQFLFASSCPSAPHRYRRRISPVVAFHGAPDQKRKVRQIRVAKSDCSQSGKIRERTQRAQAAQRSSAYQHPLHNSPCIAAAIHPTKAPLLARTRSTSSHKIASRESIHIPKSKSRPVFVP